MGLAHELVLVQERNRELQSSNSELNLQIEAYRRLLKPSEEESIANSPAGERSSFGILKKQLSCSLLTRVCSQALANKARWDGLQM